MSNRLPVLAAEIQRAHAGAEAAATTSAELAIEAGRSLIEAKALVRHGEWLPFLAEAGIPKRTAQRYIALATSDLKSDTVTHLGGIAAALRFLGLRAKAMAAFDEAEAACLRGSTDERELLEPIERAMDLMTEMVGMFDPVPIVKLPLTAGTGAAGRLA